MGLFSRLKDTVFLKENTDLEKQLVELKDVRKKLKNTEIIDKDIKLIEYGIMGEKEISFELKNANIGMYVLHDITFEYNGNKAQIDYLIFTRGYFYLIECKNLIGNITVDSNGQFYREYEYNGKKIKESFYSPYTQAVRHQDMLKKVWNNNHNRFENYIGNIIHGENYFKPLVVLSNSKSILNIKYAPKEIKNNIIRADQLIRFIQKDINNISSSKLYGDGTLKRACEIWLSRSVPNEINIANKYLNMIEKNEEINNTNLENELKKFRKDKSSTMNIPAYYVFNDEEMNKLINMHPVTIEELRRSKILSDIKIKCHGEEIIKIIKNSYINKD